jgi:hypothetical protein
MAKKGGNKAAPGKRATLSDADAVFTRILTELRADPSHPKWPVILRGVTALKELNQVLCLLATEGNDGDFGDTALYRP